MFSLDRFSLSRFSLGTVEGNTIQVEGSFSDELQSVSGVAVPVYSSAFVVDVFRGSSKGTIAINSAFQSYAGMFSDVIGNANIIGAFDAGETFTGDTTGYKDEKIVGLWAEDLTVKSWASKPIPTKANLTDVFGSYIFASKDILVSPFVFEVLGTLSEAGKQSTDQAMFSVSIPAGGELRIDSELFRVLLDGENALHTQSGDWINLSREVLYLDIETASGGTLEGSITYQERYL